VRPEHDERFRRIADDYLDRPGGDYAELLRRGQVTPPDGVEPEQWRAEIRAKARADKIRVFTIRSGDRAIAARRLSVPKDQELGVLTAAMERGEALRGVVERARLLGHEIVRWSRTTRRASRCARTARRGSMFGSMQTRRSWTASARRGLPRPSGRPLRMLRRSRNARIRSGGW